MDSNIRTLLIVLSIFFQPLVLAQDIEIPVLRLVTVDRATQQVYMKWTAENPLLLNGYIVKRRIFDFGGVVDGTINNIAEINDRDQMEYIDISMGFGPANPGVRAETYFIVSFDESSGTRRLSNMSNGLSTIYLHPVSFDLCREQNSLLWTSYKGFGNGPDGYRVYYSDTQAGAPVLVANVPKTDTSYIHRQVDANRQYHYFVVAYSNSVSDTSVSNVKAITTVMPPPPDIMNADYGSVEESNKVSLSFTVDDVAEVFAYRLLKSANQTGPWDTLTSFPRGISNIGYVDDLKTNTETAYYKVVAINQCRIESRQSNLAQNIVLSAVSASGTRYTNEISWKPYTSWLGGTETYRLFRSIDGAPFEEIGSFGSGVNTYSDDITQFVQPDYHGTASKGYFCYYVLANEGPGNPYGITGTSKSNVACIQREAVVFVPNAFNPNSQFDENRTFRPVLSFANDYSLTVYDRWGGILFRSGDPLHGWDGTYKGQMMPKGTYVYLLSYRSKDNKKVEKAGQVNLVY